jgi:hypothetical protein
MAEALFAAAAATLWQKAVCRIFFVLIKGDWFCWGCGICIPCYMCLEVFSVVLEIEYSIVAVSMKGWFQFWAY